MSTVQEQFNAFFHSSLRNKWLDDGILKVYVRKGYRYFDGKTVDSLEVANVAYIDYSYEGSGYLGKFMQEMELYRRLIFVESILSERLLAILERNGFEILDVHHPMCARKLP